MADDDPPIRRLKLKPKEIEPMDQPAIPGEGTALSVKLIHQMNANAERGAAPARAPGEDPGHRVPEGFLRREVEPTDPRPGPADEGVIAVQDMLRKNLEAAEADERNRVLVLHKRRSGRSRDFLVLLGLALAAALVVAIVFRRTPEVIALGILVIALGLGMVCWVMFSIMDRY